MDFRLNEVNLDGDDDVENVNNFSTNKMSPKVIEVLKVPLEK